MSKRPRKPWTAYPKRVCRSMHECKICGQLINLGEGYRDGGYGRRAHERCVFEVCECGDFRHQHEDDRGICEVASCGDGFPDGRCKKFRR